MADINTVPSFPVQKPEFYVYTKGSLNVSTPWNLQPDLYCDRVTRRVNGMDEAMLTFQSGTVRQIGGTQVEEAEPLDLRGQFVRIEFADATTGDFVWTGYIADEGTRRDINAPQGFKAVGLEYFLDRNQILETVIEDGKRIGRAVPFNDGSVSNGFAFSSRGNKSNQGTTSGVPEFAASENERAEWTVKDIVQYLVEHFHPENNVGVTNPCTWASELGSYLDSYIVGFNPDGKTVFEVLNSLINPRRSLCWWLEYTETTGGTGTATINVASLNKDNVTLPGGGGTLPGNIADFTLDFDDDPTVSQQGIQTLSRGEYRAIRTRGARITSTFTSQVGDAFTTDWVNLIKTEYDAAAFYTDGYPDLPSEDKAKRNDAFRRDERFYRVFCAYRIPSNWDGTAGGELCFPADLIGGSASENMTFHANWLRVLPRTLLAQGTDYQSVSYVEKTSPEDTADDLLPPFGLVLVETPEKYQYVDKLGHADYATGTPLEEKFSAAFALAVQQDSPGILLRPSNGLNHMLADNHFEGAEGTTVDPELDYDTLRFTVSVEADHHVEAVYPVAPQSGFYSELLIDVGDQYRLDYLVPGTVVRLYNGTLVHTDGGVIRDDRNQLEDIARFAYEWYREPKKTVSVTWSQMRTWFELGYLITQLGTDDPTDVNTVVGEITYDFARMTTSIRTIGDQLSIREVI